MTYHRQAPYVHTTDGTPCWTKNCSKPNNAAPQTFEDLQRVSTPPSEQELATFAAWLEDQDNVEKTDAIKATMLKSVSHVEPSLPGQTWDTIDKAKLHAFFEDAYQERLHILKVEEEDQDYPSMYHAMTADTLMVEALSRYDEASDDGDIDAMRDTLLLNHMNEDFKTAAQTWLEHRAAQDYPYDENTYGVSLFRQSYEEAYQAGVSTALEGWKRRDGKNPYDAEANGVFPQDNSDTNYGHQDFYNKGLQVGLSSRLGRR